MSSSTISRAWMVAASVGAVEALKDQGFCRWNYTIKSVHQHAKNYNHLGSLSQIKNKFFSSSQSAALMASKKNKDSDSEESLRKVMFLSCWGPN